MANGKNAGRLFPDCTGEYGYGQSHHVPKDAKVGDVVECSACHGHFEIVAGEHGEELRPVEQHG